MCPMLAKASFGWRGAAIWLVGLSSANYGRIVMTNVMKRLSCVAAIKWPAVQRAYERLLKLDRLGQDYGDKRSNQGGYDAD